MKLRFSDGRYHGRTVHAAPAICGTEAVDPGLFDERFAAVHGSDPSLAVDRMAFYTRRLEASYPKIWRELEQARLALPATRRPPSWCHLPLDLVLDVVSGMVKENRTAGPSGLIATGLTVGDMPEWMDDALLIALVAPWRLTKGLYQFDLTIENALATTDLTERIPGEALFHLPAWACYILGRHELENDLPRTGALVAPLWQTGLPPQFYVATDTPTGLRLFSLEIDPEGLWPRAEKAVESHFDEHGFRDANVDDEGRSRSFHVRDVYEQWKALLAPTFYLCAENADLRPARGAPAPTTLPQAPAAAKRFATQSSTTWDVGYRIGATIRTMEADADAEASPRTTGAGRNRPRPHVRAAHWHHFWRGGRDEPNRELILHWLPPTLVATKTPSRLVPTVRPVS